eukprot:2265118-Rhodomonas_salina.3
MEHVNNKKETTTEGRVETKRKAQRVPQLERRAGQATAEAGEIKVKKKQGDFLGTGGTTSLLAPSTTVIYSAKLSTTILKRH